MRSTVATRRPQLRRPSVADRLPDRATWAGGHTAHPCRVPRGQRRTGGVRLRTLQRALMRRSVNTKKTLPDPDSLKGETPTEIINIFLRRMWTGQFRSKPCSHVHLARADIGPASEVCAECVALGDSWPALRMCLLCGYVGCCDKSKNKHAREHFRQKWPSLDPALQRAGYGLGVVLRGRGASRPEMTEVFVAGAYFGSPRTGVLTRWQARRKSWALPIFDPTRGGF